MTIFTPYMNADLYQHTPEWQKIERYDFCSQEHLTEKSEGVLSRVRNWFRKDDGAKKAA